MLEGKIVWAEKDMDTKDIINRLQEIKPYLQQEYAVKTLGLFGSFADGSYTDNSDVDILVELYGISSPIICRGIEHR
jgi:predicted nucleotidyltransferase